MEWHLIKLAWLFSLVALLSFESLTLSCMLSNLLKVQKAMFYPAELAPQIDSILEVWTEVGMEFEV